MLERPAPRDGLERAAIGRRAASLVTHRSGKYVRHQMNRELGHVDVAVDATLRAAARTASQRAHARRERPSAGPARLRVEPDDLRDKIRAHRSPYAVVIVVDNSYSVHADQMVEKAKGLAQALLDDAAAQGDRVAVVAFNGGVPEATVAVPLTRSATLLRRRLAAVPLAGRTPLPDAIRLARRLLRQELLKRPNAVPLVVVITDGLPTIPLQPGGDPLEDLLLEARALRRLRIATVVADTSDRTATVGGCGTEFAEAAGGHWLAFDELVPETLEEAMGRRPDKGRPRHRASASRRTRGADS